MYWVLGFGSEFKFKLKFEFWVDLTHDAKYECLVQAKNQYGWSEASRIHRFLTHSNAFGTYYNEARAVKCCRYT